MGRSEIVVGPIAFGNAAELITALQELQDMVDALEPAAVVRVRAYRPFINGRVHLEEETLSDDSTIYNVIIRGA